MRREHDRETLSYRHNGCFEAAVGIFKNKRKERGTIN